MSAEAIPPERQGWPGPNLHRQRLSNYTVEDVLALPDDAPRVELRDGVMLVVPSPTFGHQKIGHRLWRWLEDHAPEDLEAYGAVGVAVAFDQTFDPDVLLVRRETVELLHRFVAAEHVVLAVEVVSPGTRRRDRIEKPAQYAAAGIQHYWRIEQDPVHVYAYDLVGDAYKLIADTTDELVLERPFPIRLPIRDITP